jgi:peptide/nickel transport system substrate-binding protein
MIPSIPSERRRAASGRRRRWVAVLAATALLASACGGSDDADGSSPSPAPAPGATDRPLVVGQVAEPASLDPHAVTAVNDFRINVNLYDGLVRYDEESLNVEPALATAWTVSDDGLVYTFTLREGVTFHDGSTFDAEAVVFNFERMLDEDHPYHGTGPFPLAGQFYGNLDTIEATGDYEVVMTLSSPFAPFLSNLAYPSGLIISPAAVMEHGQDVGRNPSGTGPYRFVEWRSNERVTLERNADYWDGPPPVSGVVFRPIVEATTRVNELLTGGVDLIVEVPPDELAGLRSDAGYTVYEQAGPHVWFLILNLLEPPFDDVRVRQAANHAINRVSLVDDVLQGTATVANSPTPPAFGSAHNPDIAGYDYDPERARQLLAEAGYPDGVDVTFYVTEGGSGMLDPVPMGEAIQADLRAVGINASVQTFEWNSFLGEVNPGLEGKANMAQMAWMTADPDTLPFLTLRTNAWPDAGGFNSGYYSNPEVDRLLEAAQVETDPAERDRLYRAMQEIVVEDAPWVFVANWKQNAASTSALSGFDVHPSFLLRLNRAALG